jgi:beta-N-acetylhexosaminidase
MTLEQKVGQMFMLAFAGSTAKNAAALLRDHHLGACYLSNDNFIDPGQSASLMAELQALARAGSGIPALLAADQEGAWAVLTPHSCVGPGNMGLGATWSPEDTRAMYAVFGRELRAAGLNADLAPDADVNSNPLNPIIGVRSFGEDPEMVARHVRAGVAGLHDAGVVAAAKHFPGHGDTATDTHRGLARVDRDQQVLERREFVPFRAAIDAGVDIVMTSHILFPALDPQRPATLSPKILHDLLRDAMGFTGVIVTDSFNMGAVRRVYDPLDAVIQTVQAGADMVLLAEERYGDESGDYMDRQARLVGGLVAAVEKGEVPLSRINDAVARILALKKRYRFGEPSPPGARTSADAVGSAAHREIERKVATDAVVLVQNRGAVVPLNGERINRIVMLSATDPDGYRRMAAGRGIGPNVVEHPSDVATAEIRKRRPDAVSLALRDGEWEAQADTLAGASAIVVVTEKFPLAGFDFPDASQHRLIRWLLSRRSAPVIVLACRDPYELAQFPEVDAYICAVGYRPACVQAAVGVLFGETAPRGRLPVSIPGLYPVGHAAVLS